MPKQAPAERPEPREIELVDLSCQPNAVELKEDLRVNASFDELTAVVVRYAKIRYVKPERKR